MNRSFPSVFRFDLECFFDIHSAGQEDDLLDLMRGPVSITEFRSNRFPVRAKNVSAPFAEVEGRIRDAHVEQEVFSDCQIQYVVRNGFHSLVLHLIPLLKILTDNLIPRPRVYNL
jgi:hypothetical protein